MNMTVKTQSGTIYNFTQENGHTFFHKGSLSGKVIRIDPISIGKPINMDFHKESRLGGYEACTMFINSTPVINISVIL